MRGNILVRLCCSARSVPYIRCRGRGTYCQDLINFALTKGKNLVKRKNCHDTVISELRGKDSLTKLKCLTFLPPGTYLSLLGRLSSSWQVLQVTHWVLEVQTIVIGISEAQDEHSTKRLFLQPRSHPPPPECSALDSGVSWLALLKTLDSQGSDAVGYEGTLLKLRLVEETFPPEQLSKHWDVCISLCIIG